MSTERALIGPIRVDDYTMDVVYGRYFRKLYLLVRGKVGEKPPSEDIVLETFADLWNRRDKVEFPNEDAQWAYIRQSALNRTHDYLEKTRRDKVFLKNHAILLTVVSPDEEWMESTEKRARTKAAMFEKLHRAIDQLPPQYQGVIKLSLRGLNSVEIGDEMRISDKTARSYRRNAIKALRKSFTGSVEVALIVVFLGAFFAEFIAHHLSHILLVH
jgi:RNA polymerase sigma factor (sigma-70 family)